MNNEDFLAAQIAELESRVRLNDAHARLLDEHAKAVAAERESLHPSKPAQG